MDVQLFRHPRLRMLLVVVASSLLWTLLAIAQGCSGGPGERDNPNTLTLIYTNDMRGEVRSCGCAAKDYGGLGRRATYVQAVRDTASNVVLVESGGFFGADLNYGREKAELTLKSLGLMNYDAIVVGEEDLAFGLDYLVKRAQADRLPVLGANLYMADGTLAFSPRKVVTTAGGLKVGMIGVLDPALTLPPKAQQEKVVAKPMQPEVARHVSALRDSVDLVVLVAHVPRAKAMQLASDNPGIDLIVHGHDGRPVRRLKPRGNAYLLQVSDKGRYVGKAYVELADGGGVAAIQNAADAMTKTFVDDEAVAALFRSYDLTVADREREKALANVGRGAVTEPFQGSEACQSCHAPIYQHWKETKHGHAFEVLSSQNRQYDRDCTPCHTVGFYKTGGFRNVDNTPHLIHVGCESCHGNGFRHVKDPTQPLGEPDPESTCRSCHTVEQTPEFDFTSFWGRIDHPGPTASGGGR